MIDELNDRVRVYLDRARADDPRTVLAVRHRGEEQTHLFDADGNPTGEEELEALLRSAEGEMILTNAADRDWAASYFSADGNKVGLLPASEETRLRLLAGRARKADPYRTDPADAEPSCELTPEAPAEGSLPVAEASDGPDDPATSASEDHLDFLDGWEDIFSDITDIAECGDATDGADPADVAVQEAPMGAERAEPEPEVGSEQISVYPVLRRDLEASIGLISDSFSPRLYHGRAARAALEELNDAAREPGGVFRPGRHELHEVRLRSDILRPDRYIAIAWTERVEDRCRLRMVRFNDAPDLARYQEEAMRMLMNELSRYARGPIEALLPPSLVLSPPLMRAGGFVHQIDLPRWCWGEDCALWVRPAG